MKSILLPLFQLHSTGKVWLDCVASTNHQLPWRSAFELNTLEVVDPLNGRPFIACGYNPAFLCVMSYISIISHIPFLVGLKAPVKASRGTFEGCSPWQITPQVVQRFKKGRCCWGHILRRQYQYQYQSVRLPGFLLKTIHPGKRLIRWARVCCVASVVFESLQPYEQ